MRKVGGILLSFALLGAPAFAEGDGQGEGGSDDAAAAAAGSDLSEASGLSTAEKKSQAEKMVGDVRSALQRGTEVLQEAREKKDIVQLNCVNEKLTQIKGLLKIAEDASVKMYEAMASGLEDVVNHEFTKMSVANEKVGVLRAEVEQCVGEASIYTGDTVVEVEQEGGEDGDPTSSTWSGPSPEMPAISSLF